MVTTYCIIVILAPCLLISLVSCEDALRSSRASDLIIGDDRGEGLSSKSAIGESETWFHDEDVEQDGGVVVRLKRQTGQFTAIISD